MKMKNRSQRGFTLIEMLVVLVLISLLAGLVGPKLFNQVGSSKTKVASAQIELFVSALNTYRLDVGDYPTSQQGLNALMTAPEGSTGWNGPYMAKEVPVDPWNRSYVYQRKDDGEFALYSYGRNGTEGGEGEDQDVGIF